MENVTLSTEPQHQKKNALNHRKLKMNIKNVYRATKTTGVGILLVLCGRQLLLRLDHIGDHEEHDEDEQVAEEHLDCYWCLLRFYWRNWKKVECDLLDLNLSYLY